MSKNRLMIEPAGLFAEALSDALIFSFLFVFNAANWIKRVDASPVYFPLQSEPLAFFACCFQLPKCLIASLYSRRKEKEIFLEKTSLQAIA